MDALFLTKNSMEMKMHTKEELMAMDKEGLVTMIMDMMMKMKDGGKCKGGECKGDAAQCSGK